MSDDVTTADSIVRFIRAVEPMKSHTRSAWTAAGTPECIAAHSWRLCILALAVGPYLDDIDTDRLLRICLVPDLGEAIHGDVPAPDQSIDDDRHLAERAAVESLADLAGDVVGRQVIELWDEYSEGRSAEALVAKALDKIETISQHNQGANPEEFDYGFNLEYGREIPISHGVIRKLREIVDRQTASLADSAEPDGRS